MRPGGPGDGVAAATGGHPQIEASREALDATLEFIDSVEAACVHNLAVLSMLGGNIYLGIPGVGAWTLVTHGPRAGLYAEATDDEIDFALICEEWVLHELLDRIRDAAERKRS